MTHTILCKLSGGPMDGDTVLMIPKGSVSPPQVLGYVRPSRDPRAYVVEEYAMSVAHSGWPCGDETVEYVHTYTREVKA